MEGYYQGMLEALRILFIAGFVFFIYRQGKEHAEETQNIWLMLFKGFILIVFIAFFLNSRLGTHSENCNDRDPVYGGSCDRVQDYEPTRTDYNENFTYYFVLFSVPLLLGSKEGYKNNRIKGNKNEQGKKS